MLTDGTVNLAHRKAYCSFVLRNGDSALITRDLSDADIRLYQSSPDTYFGVVKPVRKGITSPLEAFDFFYDSFKDTPRETLLSQMASWPDANSRAGLPQKELARYYSAGMAGALINSGKAAV